MRTGDSMRDRKRKEDTGREEREREKRREEKGKEKRRGAKLMTKAPTAVWLTALLKRLCGSLHEWTRNMGIACFLHTHHDTRST